MSLVITSNIAQEDNPEFSNAFKPFSYQNRLLNTMRIPANSEIALQSAKINKNGLFVLDRANAGFCHYFGVPIGTDATKLAAGEEIASLDDSTTQPFRGTIGAGQAFRAGGRNERNIEDMTNDLQAGVNACAFHPSLILADYSSTIKVDATYDATTLSLKGFEFKTTQEKGTDKLLKANVVWTDVSKNEAYNFTQAGGVVSSTDKAGFYVQSRQYPLCQNEGTAVFDIAGANTGSWMVGLSRINRARPIGAGDYDFTPTYFDNSLTNTALKTGRLYTRSLSLCRYLCCSKLVLICEYFKREVIVDQLEELK